MAADDRARFDSLQRQGRDNRAALQRQNRDNRAAIQSELRDLRASVNKGGSGQDWSEVESVVYTILPLVVGVLAALAAVPLAVGHLSARLFDGEWPSYGLGDVPEILGGLMTNPFDPAAAWEPVNEGGQPPEGSSWWLVFVAVLVLAGAAAYFVYSMFLRSQSAAAHVPEYANDHVEADGFSGPVAPFNGWSGGKALRDLWIHPENDQHRLVVGRSGKRTVAINPLHSLLVVGPAHSGKTSGLAIPTLLEWRGPAVVASTKNHLMDETVGWRSRQGEVHVFDPAAVTPYPGAGWSPLAGCGTWRGSIRMAQHLTWATKASVGGQIGGIDAGDPQGDALVGSALATSLAPFLYAAAADGRTILEAAEWIEREERDEVVRILRPIDKAAAHAHETTFFRDDATRSRYFHLMYQALSVYSDPYMADTATRHDIVAEDLLRGGKDTIYLTAPEHDQVRFQPIFATIVRQILATSNERFAAAGTPLDPPLLLLLDEAVGVASLKALGEVAAGGAAKGVQVVSIFEDLGRLDGLQPNASTLLIRNHRAKLVFPGRAADLASAGASAQLLAPEVSRELGPGEAALLYGGERPARVTVRRWYEDDELNRRVESSPGMVPASERRIMGRASPLDVPPEYSLVEETRGLSWLRERRDERREERRREAPADDVAQVSQGERPSKLSVDEILSRVEGGGADPTGSR